MHVMTIKSVCYSRLIFIKTGLSQQILVKPPVQNLKKTHIIVVELLYVDREMAMAKLKVYSCTFCSECIKIETYINK
jgi:hypothetical protein